MQNLPDVMDIEVSPGSGEWRVVGSQGAWMSIREDLGKLLDARVLIKPEPQLGGAAPALGAVGGQPLPYLHASWSANSSACALYCRCSGLNYIWMLLCQQKASATMFCGTGIVR